MSDPLKLQFIIEAVDGVRGIANGVLGGVKSMARNVVGEFAGITRATEGFSRSYAGIATAIGGGLEIRDLIGQEDMFNRLRVQNDMTEGAIEKLHETIVSTAKDAKINLHDMLGAVSAFSLAGGDVAKFGEDAKTAAAMIQLLGGQGDDVGRTIAALRNQLNVDDVTRSVATLYEQTKNVQGGFGAAAKNINELAAMYHALGHTGTDAARELGAVYAVISEGTRGTAREAGTEMKGLLSALSDPVGELRGRLLSMGVISSEDFGFDKQKMHASISDIVKGMVAFSAKSDTNAGLMAHLLGPDLMRDLMTGFARPELLNQKLDVAGDPKKFFGDASEAAKSLTGSLNQLKTTIDEIGNSWFAQPFRWMAWALSAWHGLVGAIVAVGGAIAILGNVLPWVRGGFQTFWNLLVWGATVAIPAVIGTVSTVAEVIATASAAMLEMPFVAILGGIAAVATAITAVIYSLTHAKEMADALKLPDGGSINPFTGQVVSPAGVPQTSSWDDWWRVINPANMFGGAPAAPSRSELAPQRSDRLPAFGGAPAPGAAANNQVNGQVTVTFENAPSNLAVKKTESDNPNVDLDVNMGYGLMMVP
ncbi:MAG TPA: hypothetical protein VGF92_15755 [Stellaceae bacterium]|jgi:hypothetical protein